MILLHFRDKSLRMLRRRTGGQQRSHKVTSLLNLKSIFSFISISSWLLYLMMCFLSELEQSEEQSKKEYQLLKEKSQCREKELKQVHLNMKSIKHQASFRLHTYTGYIDTYLYRISNDETIILLVLLFRTYCLMCIILISEECNHCSE